MTAWTRLTLVPVVCVFILAGCDVVPKSAPKMIEADVTNYLACRGFVWVDTKTALAGATTYEIRFTDARGITQEIRGIKQLIIADIPATVPSTLPPYLPNPKTDKDKEGNPFVEGHVYTWSGGNRAKLENGDWKPEPRRNPVCDAD